jgi:hypothetical protein
MQSEANMLHAARRLFAWLNRSRTAADEVQQRHQAWDRDCRARGMTAREQAQELQIRCAWVRLRTKASAAARQRPARWREILDRIAADEARTLTAIGGAELAAVFLRAYQATDPLEILSPEAASVVLVRSPSLVPDLPPVKSTTGRTKAGASAKC